jgi:pimeloyl-ACP methyl ester carboxylesterase
MRGLTERTETFGGTRCRYFTGGDGPPVILLHGLGGAAVNWTLLAPLLARGHRVVAPDLPGHGRSGKLAGLGDLRPFADVVEAVGEREEALPAAVVGHSLGGVVALRLAVDRPEAVRALVLVETAGIVSTLRRAEIAFAITGALRPARRIARLRHRVATQRELRRATFAYWGAADPATLAPEAVLGFLEAAAEAHDVRSAGAALVRENPREWLHGIRCPALLVWGARDHLVPIEDGFEFARRLRAPIRTIAGAGHLVIGERPAECAAVIEEFLARLDRVGEVDELPLEPEALG